MDQKNLAVLTGDRKYGQTRFFFFCTRKCVAVLPGGQKEAAVITRWAYCRVGRKGRGGGFTVIKNYNCLNKSNENFNNHNSGALARAKLAPEEHHGWKKNLPIPENLVITDRIPNDRRPSASQAYQCLLSHFLATFGAQEKTDCTLMLWLIYSCQNKLSADQ